MRNVVLPYDGSAPAQRAVKYLLDMKPVAGTLQVHLINVQSPPNLYGNYVSGQIIQEMHAGALEHAVAEMQEPKEMLEAAGFIVHVHGVVGEASREIAKLVKSSGCDTVVMGTRGLGKIGSLFMGSVATQVIHEVSVPVLLVK